MWDKGDIEGKRGFNGGNYSPFYQSPFNCWEHILVFRKPGVDEQQEFRSRIWRHPPVLKMVRGENRHGHSAPFPEALPNLAMEGLSRGSVVLDPFAGSLTTGRVARRLGHDFVCIELREEYCRLGMRLMAQAEKAPTSTQMTMVDYSDELASIS